MEDRKPWDQLIGLKDFGLRWPVLYAFSFALQFGTGFIRSLFAALVLLIVNLFTVWWFGLHLPVDLLALVIGYAPLLVSLATLILPFGGWFWQQSEGGRPPTEGEQAALGLALAHLREAEPGLRAPGRWFVVDEDGPFAAAYGNSLMVTTGLLDSPYLAPTIAHELSHLASSDGRVTAALNRMVIGPQDPVAPIFPKLGWLLSGRAARDLMSIPWAMYWRSRELDTDAFAKRLGQGRELAGVLALYPDRPTPWKPFGTSSHPWTEHRIEALEHEDD